MSQLICHLPYGVILDVAPRELAEGVTTKSSKLKIWWWEGEETMVFPVNWKARSWGENGTREGMWEAWKENREWGSIVFETGNEMNLLETLWFPISGKWDLKTWISHVCALSQPHSAPGQVQVDEELSLSWFVFTQRVQWREGAKDLMVFDEHWMEDELGEMGYKGERGCQSLRFSQGHCQSGSGLRATSWEVNAQKAELQTRCQRWDGYSRCKITGGRGRAKVTGGSDVKE